MHSDLGVHLDHASLYKDKKLLTPIKKCNMYQLVYNELDDDDNDDDERFGGLDFMKNAGVQGDGMSSDLHLTQRQRINRILGRSESEAWSAGDGSLDLSNDSELMVSSNGDMFLGDTFETDLKEARTFHQKLGTVSPISGTTNQRRFFEDGVDLPVYNPPYLHSTPIKNCGFEAKLTKEDLTSDIPSPTDLVAEDKRGSNFCSSGLIRFFVIPKTNEGGRQRTFPRQLFGSVLSPSKPRKVSNRSLIYKLKTSIDRSLPSNKVQTGRLGTLAIKYDGPQKFEVDPVDCFLDDDVVDDVAHLCTGAQEPAVRPSGRVKDEIILSNRVDFDADDDYESALHQDPSNPDPWQGRDFKDGSSGGDSSRSLSGLFRGWSKGHKLLLLMVVLILIIVALVAATVTALYQTIVLTTSQSRPLNGTHPVNETVFNEIH